MNTLIKIKKDLYLKKTGLRSVFLYLKKFNYFLSIASRVLFTAITYPAVRKSIE